jgi:hypothetical protein
MVKNMGSVDRIIRVVLGVGLVITGAVMRGGFWALAALGVVFLATSAISFCPLYLPFRISTRRKGSGA